jgi:DNA-binding MarR family transcriptional regulator
MNSAAESALAFSELFGALYLRFHRRGAKRSVFTPQGWAVVQHLAIAGPLTITEAARHMDRAQSVMSEIVDGLERRGLLARLRDERDRRRTLVWLTDAGRQALEAERQVLSLDELERAFTGMDSARSKRLLEDLKALVEAKTKSRAPNRRK